MTQDKDTCGLKANGEWLLWCVRSLKERDWKIMDKKSSGRSMRMNLQKVAQNVKIFTFMLTNPPESVHHRRPKQTGRQDDLFN